MAKYSADQLKALGAKGHAFKNPDGSYSYPIDDVADLKNAIHAVGRGNSSHDAIRKYIIGRAKSLGQSSLIPDNWGSDGSIKKSAEDDAEERTAGHSHAHKHGDQEPHTHAHTHGAGNYEHSGDDPEVGHTHEHVEQNSARDDGAGPDDDDNIDAAGGMDLCPTCDGTGQDDNGTVCPDCDGSGLAASDGEPARSAKPARSRRSATREIRTMAVEGLEMRDDSTGAVKVSGYACRTGTSYPVTDFLGSYDETVRSGAFKKTLADGADVRFLINHDGLPLARTKSGTLNLSEDGHGLRCEAELDPASPLVQQLRSAMARGDVDQMSFAFQAVRQSWDKDYTTRDILEAKLMDVSAVTYPASPTTTIGLRAAAARNAAQVLPTARLEAVRGELRAGASLSSSTTAVLQHVLDLVAAADEAVDKAQPLLAGVFGVDNPDKAHVVSGPADTVAEAKGADLNTFEKRMAALKLLSENPHVVVAEIVAKRAEAAKASRSLGAPVAPFAIPNAARHPRKVS